MQTDKIVNTTVNSYDQIAAWYDQKNHAVGLPQQYERFTSILATDGTLLDLGCGSGRDTLYFAQQNHSVVGLDLSLGQLSQARQHLPTGAFVQADMRNLPFAHATFKGIWACASLLHLPKSAAIEVLSQVHQVLKPQGTLFLSVKRLMPNAEAESWLIGHEGHSFFFAYYLPTELRNLTQDIGFELKGLSENTSPEGVRWINLYAQKA